MVTENGTDTRPFRRASRRRVVTYLLWVVVVAACVFTALQIREFFLLRPAGLFTPGSPSAESVVATNEAEVDDGRVGNPLELRHTAQRAGAMTRYADAPAGLEPPVGASAVDGWQQRSYGATRQLRTYRCPQELGDVAAHYRRAATEKGLSPAGEWPGPGTLFLQWTAPGLHVTLSLRQETPKQTRVAVTAIR